LQGLTLTVSFFLSFFFSKVSLTEMLIDEENSEYPDVPVNPYRKLLGTEIMSLHDDSCYVLSVRVSMALGL